MSRADSPFSYFEHWLDKRRDGRSPDIWQIATKFGSSVRYGSTGCRDLEQAKAKLVAHVDAARAAEGSSKQDTTVFALFKLYWREHGQNVVSPDQIASSLRVFIGFLASQKDLGPLATVEDLSNAVFERFIRWRLKEHGWDVIWLGEPYKHTAKGGVNGTTIQRNIDDVRAALMHNQKVGRIRAPYIPQVPKNMLSGSRTRIFTTQELGAIFGYARLADTAFYQSLALMLATAARPEAALAFVPSEQVRGEAIDLHPVSWRLTKKINPVVPAIPQLQELIKDWEAAPVNSRKRAWSTMRRVLGWEKDRSCIFKVIRHTIATMLLDHAMTGDSELTPMHIEGLLGHSVMKRVTAGYAKWNVRHLAPVVPALSQLWDDVHAEADKWASVHSLSTAVRGKQRNLIKT